MIEYLRSFIKGLQRNVGVIEEYLRLLDEKTKNKYLRKLQRTNLQFPE